MLYNEIKETAKQPALMASLTGFINPVMIAPAIAIGTVGVAGILIIKAVKNLKAENKQLLKDKNALKNDLEQLTYESEYSEIEGEQDFEPYDEPLDLTVADGSPNGSITVESTVGNMSDEALQKEMIRQTMSELGKRSAAARAKKKSKNK